MQFEITVPTDKAYVERLFDCLEYIEAQEEVTPKSKRLRSFIIEEFRRIRAKYNGNPRIDFEAIIEAEDNSSIEKPLYQNTKLDKYRVGRFGTEALDPHIDRVAKIIRGKKNGDD